MDIITVLMSVYNGELFLEEAIESVLSQTFGDFTFLIIDDCSQDKSAEIVASFRDQRIRFIRNGRNLGQTKTLNEGLRLIKSKYVARMDQDDVSDPLRLEYQISYLESHSDMAVLGSWFHVVDNIGGILYDFCPPTSHDDIVDCFVAFNPFGHSSLCMRTSIVKQLGCYPEEYKFAQDLGLLINIARHHYVGILSKPLVSIRSHNKQTIHEASAQYQVSREVVAYTKSALRSFDYDMTHRLRGRFTILLSTARLVAIRLGLLDAFCLLMDATTSVKACLFESKQASLKIMNPL